MKLIAVLLLAAAMVLCKPLATEPIVTKEYTEYLKQAVSWEVVDYEDNIFRGWTTEEARTLLGLSLDSLPQDLPQHVASDNLPASLSWKSVCDHGPQNQANCGSCWAFGTVGMISSRCCLHSEDHGWLSPQELVSCDNLNYGCNGGSPHNALIYVVEAGGLVPESCFPYKAVKTHCPTACADGKDWEDSHQCSCHGITECKGVKNMRSCLQTGPITVGYGVCKSFFDYKSGIYACDCKGQYEGYHAVLLQGYADTPKCHWIVRNSWGPAWGDHGYFKIECTSCGIDGELSGANVMCNKVE